MQVRPAESSLVADHVCAFEKAKRMGICLWDGNVQHQVAVLQQETTFEWRYC